MKESRSKRWSNNQTVSRFMKSSQIILGLGAVAFVFAALVLVTQRLNNEAPLPFKDFSVKTMETRKVSGLSLTNIEAENNGVLLRLELVGGMNEKLANLYLEEKKVGIESLFLTQPAHYPGIITREVECSEKFQPEKGTINETAYYIMYANSRFSYGVCVPDLVAYRSIVGLRYCRDQKVFVEAEFFFPPETFDKDRALQLLSSFQCP